MAQKETWDGVNVTTYTRDVEWTAKEAFIGAKTNCLATWRSRQRSRGRTERTSMPKSMPSR